MFKDEYASFFQKSFFKNQIRNLGQLLKGIGGVGKDEVELKVAGFHKAENITANNLTLGVMTISKELLHAFSNEPMMIAVHFYAHHLTATP